MNFFIKLLEGIFIGVVSSFAYQVINHIRKPKILVADKIAKTVVNGKKQYKIKIVNLKKSYIKNMKIYVMLADTHIESNNRIVKTIPLTVSQGDISFIDPYSKKDKDAKYAIRLGILEDLEAVWCDETHMTLNIKIYCENEHSSSGAVFERNISKDSIVLGNFEFGKSINII